MPPVFRPAGRVWTPAPTWPVAESAGASQKFRWQQSIHRSGAEAFEVQSHKLETQGLEDASEFGGHLWSEGTVQLFAGDLDTHDVAVMTDPYLAEAEGVESVFALFDDAQGLASDLASVLDARREAGGSRLVPNPKAGGAGEFTDILLSESSLA